MDMLDVRSPLDIPPLLPAAITISFANGH